MDCHNLHHSRARRQFNALIYSLVVPPCEESVDAIYASGAHFNNYIGEGLQIDILFFEKCFGNVLTDNLLNDSNQRGGIIFFENTNEFLCLK